MYSKQNAVYSIHRVELQHAIYSVLYSEQSVYSTQYTVSSIRRAVHDVLCTEMATLSRASRTFQVKTPGRLHTQDNF